VVVCILWGILGLLNMHLNEYDFERIMINNVVKPWFY
jgi:hypothetical protein